MKDPILNSKPFVCSFNSAAIHEWLKKHRASLLTGGVVVKRGLDTCSLRVRSSHPLPPLQVSCREGPPTAPRSGGFLTAHRSAR